MEVNLDRGLLTIAGERTTDLPPGDDAKAALHINERFGGRFRRVVSLADDVDPSTLSADYRDGVLHIQGIGAAVGIVQAQYIVDVQEDDGQMLAFGSGLHRSTTEVSLGQADQASARSQR